MKDNEKTKQALEALNKLLYQTKDNSLKLSCGYSEAADFLCEHVWTIREALTSPQWQDIDEWHEDFGDCLFMFFRNGEFYAIEFTSPLSTTFDEEYTANCDQIFFKRVDTSDFKLPTAPTASK